MILEIPYISDLPIEYQKAVKCLSEQLETATNFKDKNSQLEFFADQYTLLPEIGDFWKEMLYDAHDNEIFTSSLLEVSKRQESDFPMIFVYEWPMLSTHGLYELAKQTPVECEKTIQKLETLISFPHFKLKIAYLCYNELIGTVVPKNLQHKYEECCQIWKEIQKADYENIEAWISALLLTGSLEYAVNNIECRLAREPGNRKLWLAYIQLLDKQKSPRTVILKVMSRCCRLFVKDLELQDTYERKLRATCDDEDISEFWIDFIKMKNNFISIQTAEDLLIEVLGHKLLNPHTFFYAALDMIEKYSQLSHLKSKIKEAQKQLLKNEPSLDSYNLQAAIKNANFENIRSQNLALPNTMVTYLYSNFNDIHLRKLYQTCKLFYSQFQVNLIYKINLKFGRDITKPQYSGYTMKLRESHNDLSSIKPFWLVSHLDIFGSLPPMLRSKITKVTLRSLEIRGHMDYNDYLFLTASKTIKKLKLSLGVQIKKNANEIATLYEILVEVPNLIYLDVNYRPLDISDLLDANFNSKLLKLIIFGYVDYDDLFEACQKHLAPKAVLHLFLFPEEGKVFMKEKILTWEPKNQRPQLIFGR